MIMRLSPMVISRTAHQLINLRHVSSRWKQTHHNTERYGNVNFRFSRIADYYITKTFLQLPTIRNSSLTSWSFNRHGETKPANEMIAVSFNFPFNDFSALSLYVFFSFLHFQTAYSMQSMALCFSLLLFTCYSTRTWSHVTNTQTWSKWVVRKTIAFCCQLWRGQWCNKWLIENVQPMSTGS